MTNWDGYTLSLNTPLQMIHQLTSLCPLHFAFTEPYKPEVLCKRQYCTVQPITIASQVKRQGPKSQIPAQLFLLF